MKDRDPNQLSLLDTIGVQAEKITKTPARPGKADAGKKYVQGPRQTRASFQALYGRAPHPETARAKARSQSSCDATKPSDGKDRDLES